MSTKSRLSALFNEELKRHALKGYIFYEYVPGNLFSSVRDDADGFEKLARRFLRSQVRKDVEIVSYLKTYFDQKKDDLHIYLNIPFCRRKCKYCHYYTNSLSAIVYPTPEHYADTLVQEMEHFFARFKIEKKVSFVALGGGTPLLLPVNSLRKIFDFLRRKTITGNSLISVETTPTEVCRPGGRAKLDLLRDYGVERISIGAQSFSNVVLRHIGANHTAESILKAYDIVRECGFTQVNFDLLCCLPYPAEKAHLAQTFSCLQMTQPEAISLYRLNRIERVWGRFFPTLRNDFQEHYEILQSIHQGLLDLKYQKQGRHYVREEKGLLAKERPIVKWLVLDGDWLAFGANGRSTIGQIGFRNVKNSVLYCNYIKKNRSYVVMSAVFDQNAFIMRYIIRSIVCNNAIHKEDFSRRFNICVDVLLGASVAYLVKIGLFSDVGSSFLVSKGCEMFDLEIINVLCRDLARKKIAAQT